MDLDKRWTLTCSSAMLPLMLPIAQHSVLSGAHAKSLPFICVAHHGIARMWLSNVSNHAIMPTSACISHYMYAEFVQHLLFRVMVVEVPP